MSKIIKYVSLNEAPHILATPQMAVAEAAKEEALPSEELQESEVSQREILEAEAQQIIDEMMKLAHGEAETIRDTARAKAQALLDEASIQAEEVREKARQEGYQTGYQAGEEAAQLAVRNDMAQEIEQTAAKAENLLETAKREGQEMLFAAERQMIELVVCIAKKVLAYEVEENPLVILPIVKAALAKVKDQDEFTIRVHPEDYEVLLQAKRDLQMMVGREQGITINADRTLDKGGCVIDTPYGSVDARLDTQLENVKKALQGVMP